jgi:hypothetical protein
VEGEEEEGGGGSFTGCVSLFRCMRLAGVVVDGEGARNSSVTVVSLRWRRVVGGTRETSSDWLQPAEMRGNLGRDRQGRTRGSFLCSPQPPLPLHQPSLSLLPSVSRIVSISHIIAIGAGASPRSLHVQTVSLNTAGALDKAIRSYLCQERQLPTPIRPARQILKERLTDSITLNYPEVRAPCLCNDDEQKKPRDQELNQVFWTYQLCGCGGAFYGMLCA